LWYRKLTGLSYRDEVWIDPNQRLNVRLNLADIGVVAHVLTTNADENNLVRRAHASTGPSAQGSVEGATGVGRERKDSDCGIVVAASIGKKCSVTIRCIIFAIDIITERFQASCCVHIPGRVAKECASTPVAVLLKPVVLLLSAN
jgi:hypothetical protein